MRLASALSAAVLAGLWAGLASAAPLTNIGELTVSPSAPATGTNIAAIALLGHKQIVMIADSRLVVATLP